MQLPDPKHFEVLLAEGDDFFAAKDYEKALASYRYVGETIENAAHEDQSNTSKWSMGLGAVVGFLVGGFWGGVVGSGVAYHLNKNRTLERLVNTPYFDLYERALTSTLAVQKRLGRLA